MEDGREGTEREIEARLAASDLGAAATCILRAYGPEIFGFLLARSRDETTAREAFSMFAEDLWRGLPGYERRATVRVWAYALARNAAVRLLASPHRRRERNLPLTAVDELSALEAAIRTETAAFLRTDFKAKVDGLRRRLSEDDRTLLILRVDRALEWVDVARVFLGEAPESALDAQAVRLRKRFQLIKQKIRRMAKEEGFVDDA